ncbi:MAG: copper resistance D family protein [Roseobacter sp.]
MQGLASVDIWAISAILAKALEYATALLALGGPLFVTTFRKAPEDVLWIARRLTIAAAIAGSVLLAMRFGIRAARISGMGVAGMTDMMMLSLIWEGPLGSAAVMRGVGALMVLAILFRGVFASTLALIGSGLIAVSYAQIGHALGDPRWVLATLLTVHLLAVGFWIAALAPLFHASALRDAGPLLHRFGVVALIIVPILMLVGVSFAWFMLGSFNSLFDTDYGWMLLLKITIFAGLLTLAALNKLRFVPAFLAGEFAASARLRRSIGIEAFCVLLILTVTATLTSVTVPPVNL